MYQLITLSAGNNLLRRKIVHQIGGLYPIKYNDKLVTSVFIYKDEYLGYVVTELLTGDMVVKKKLLREAREAIKQLQHEVSTGILDIQKYITRRLDWQSTKSWID